MDTHAVHQSVIVSLRAADHDDIGSAGRLKLAVVVSDILALELTDSDTIKRYIVVEILGLDKAVISDHRDVKGPGFRYDRCRCYTIVCAHNQDTITVCQVCF